MSYAIWYVLWEQRDGQGTQLTRTEDSLTSTPEQEKARPTRTYRFYD